MRSQRPMSLRLDEQLAIMLDLEKVNGFKTNKIINRAVAMYLEAMDLARQLKCIPSNDKEELLRYARRWVPYTINP